MDLIGFCRILEKNSRSFVKHFLAIVVFERYFFTLASFALFEAIVVLAACFSSCVVNMESHSLSLKALWQRAERVSSIPFIEGVKYLSCEEIDKGGKGTIMVDISNFMPWKIMAGPVPVF